MYSIDDEKIVNLMLDSIFNVHRVVK